MPKPVKKFALFPIAYDEVSLVDEGAAGSADVLIAKRRSQSKPCDTGSNSTGAKDGKSQRSKKWKEERHKRKEDGTYDKTSSDSKSKYGKGGTTKSKMDKACRDKKRGKTPGAGDATILGNNGPRESSFTGNKNKRRKRRYKNGGRPVVKSSLSTWDQDAHLRAMLERNVSNGR